MSMSMSLHTIPPQPTTSVQLGRSLDFLDFFSPPLPVLGHCPKFPRFSILMPPLRLRNGAPNPTASPYPTHHTLPYALGGNDHLWWDVGECEDILMLDSFGVLTAQLDGNKFSNKYSKFFNDYTEGSKSHPSMGQKVFLKMT